MGKGGVSIDSVGQEPRQGRAGMVSLCSAMLRCHPWLMARIIYSSDFKSVGLQNIGKLEKQIIWSHHGSAKSHILAVGLSAVLTSPQVTLMHAKI